MNVTSSITHLELLQLQMTLHKLFYPLKIDFNSDTIVT